MAGSDRGYLGFIGRGVVRVDGKKMIKETP